MPLRRARPLSPTHTARIARMKSSPSFSAISPRNALLLLLLFLSYFVTSTRGNSNGYDSCLQWPDHGFNQAGNAGGFTFTAKDSGGNTVTSYTGGSVYTIILGSTTLEVRGFVAAVFVGASPSSFSGTRAGECAPTTDVNVRTMLACSGGVTHVDASSVLSFTFEWTAPSPGTGTVTVWGTVVTNQFGNNYEVKLSLTEAAASSTPSPTRTPSTTNTASATPSITASVTLTPSRTPTISTTPSLTPTITPTPTLSLTSSPTPTVSLTPSPTPTLSLTSSPTMTPTISISPTTSPTVSLTPTSSSTVSFSTTPSITPTISFTSSPSTTISFTPSPTLSLTPTRSATVSLSATPTPTVSLSPTPTVTMTLSPTPTISITPSNTPSMTQSPSLTPSTSLTPSITPTISDSPSPTSSVSGSPSISISPSPLSPGASRPPTYSNSPSASNTPTSSGTPSISPTPTITPTPSITPTTSPTSTVTVTGTPTSTVTVTGSPTSSVSLTGSPSTTVTVSESPTSTVTISESRTSTVTITGSPTSTVTISITPTSTVTVTGSPTTSVTITGSPSITAAVTVSPTVTVTPTITPTGSPTPRGSVTPTSSYTPSESPTASWTPTRTASASRTPSVTPGLKCIRARCNNHGSCAANGVSCACDVGYAGATCGECAAGYARSSRLNPCVVEPSLMRADVVWRAVSDTDKVGVDGSENRTLVAEQTADVIAEVLDVNRSRVHVSIVDTVVRRRLNVELMSEQQQQVDSLDDLSRKLSSISLTITVSISPVWSSESSSTAAVASLVSALGQPSGQLNSLLTSVGGLVPIPPSNASLPIAMLSFAPETPAPECPAGGGTGTSSGGGVGSRTGPAEGAPCTFPAAVALTDRLSMAWRLDVDANLIHIQLAFASETPDDVTWFGIAFNDGPDMMGGDGVIAEPATGAVKRVALAGYTAETCPVTTDAAVRSGYSSYIELRGPLENASLGVGLPTLPSAAQPLFAAQSRATLGVDSMTAVASFTRTLSLPPGALTGKGLRSLDPTEDVYVTFAWGHAGLGEISTHVAATSGSAILNLAEGGLSTRVHVASWALIVHSIVAIVGLVVLLPLGALVVAFGRNIPDEAGAKLSTILGLRLLADAPASATSRASSVAAAGKEGQSHFSSSSRATAYTARNEGPYAWWRRAHMQLSWMTFLLVLVGVFIGIAMTPSTHRGKTAHAWSGYLVGCVILLLTALSIRLGRPKTMPPPRSRFTFFSRLLNACLVVFCILITPYVVSTGAHDARAGIAPTAVIGSAVAIILVYAAFRLFRATVAASRADGASFSSSLTALPPAILGGKHQAKASAFAFPPLPHRESAAGTPAPGLQLSLRFAPVDGAGGLVRQEPPADGASGADATQVVLSPMHRAQQSTLLGVTAGALAPTGAGARATTATSPAFRAGARTT